MTNPTPLNPEALEAGAKALFMRERKYHTPTLECPEPPNWEDLAETSMEHYRDNARAVFAVAQPVVNSVDSQSTPEGHYDAWLDTGDGYTQRKGWTLTCLWCGSEFTAATKSEALKGYRGHEESIMRALREADAERAKNRPTVNDA